MKSVFSPFRSKTLATLVCGLFGLQTAFATDGTWISTSSGVWSNTANWSGGVIADGSGFAGLFDTLDLTAPITVSLDAPVTLSRLVFSDTNTAAGGSWVLDDGGNAANTLTLGTTPSITVGPMSSGASVTINTILAGTAGLTKNGVGQLVLTRANTYTGQTTLSGGSTTLDFAAPGAPTTDILVAASTLRVAGSSTLTLNGAAGGTNSQTFASTLFATGLANVVSTPGAGGSMALNLGTITGTTGALVRFSGTGSIAGTMANTSTGGVMGLFGASGTAVNSGFATVGLDDYAAINTGAVVGGSTVSGFYTATAPSSSTNVGNWDVAANATLSSGQKAAATTRFNVAAARTITLNSGALFTNDAILVTPNVGANNTTFTGAGGWQIIRQTSPTGSQQGSVWQNNILGFLNFNAPIINGRDTGDNNFIVKGGAGTLVLGATNSYAGRLIINEGAVSVGADGNLGAANTGVTLDGGMLFGNATFTAAATRTVTLPTAGTLAAADATTMTIAGVVSGAGDLTIGSGTLVGTGAGTANTTEIIGSGAVELTGTNTFTGAINLNAGTLKAAALTNLGSGSAITFNGGTLQHAGSYDISSRAVTILAGGATIDTGGSDSTYANAIGNNGSGALTKNGAGVLTLSAAPTFTGGAVVNGGELRLNAALTGNVAVNSGGTLGGSGSITGAVTVSTGGGLAPGAGTVGTLSVSTLSLAVGSILNYEFSTLPANDLTTVSTLNGLTINGGGFNLYQVGGTSAFATAGTYNLINYSGTIAGTGTSALSVLNPQPGKSYTFGSTATDVTLTIANAGVVSDWAVDAGGSWNTAANWTGAVPNGSGETANFTFALTAPVTVTLDGNKTAGAVNFTSAQGYTIAAGSGGTLTLDNGTGQANLITAAGAHTISAAVDLASSTVAATTGTSSLTLSGVVSGVSPLTKSGTGTLDLTGTANTLSGLISVSGGTLGFAVLGSLGTSDLSIDGGTLRYNTGNTADISTKVVTIGSGGATLDTNGNDVVLTAPIGNSGTGSLTKAGAGSLTLAVGNTYSGPTTVSAGTLAISANSSLGAPATGAGLTLQDGTTLQSTATFALDNSGANSRSITVGAGGAAISTDASTTLTVSGAITGGTLTKTGAGTLNLTNTTNTLPIIVSGGTLNGGVTTASNGGFGTGAITLQGGAAITTSMSSGNTLTFANTLTIPTGESGSISTPNRMSWTGNVSGAGTLNMSVSTTVTRMDLNNSWTGFTGTLNLTGSGGVRLFNNGGTFNTNSFTSTTMDLGGSVSLNPQTNSGGNTYPIGSLSGSSATAALNGGSAGTATYSVGALNQTTTYAGTINGNAALTKTGTGTLTLTGANTHTGATIVNGGSLQVGSAGLGQTGTGNVTINNTASLLGTGSVRGTSFTAASGSSIHVGDSTAVGSFGTLTIAPALTGGSIDFLTGSTVSLGLDLGGTSDLLSFIGDGSQALNFNSNLTIGPGTLTPTAAATFNLLDWSGLASTTFDGRFTSTGLLLGNGDEASGLDLPDISGSGFFWDISAFTTDGTIAIVIVPEPSRALLLLAGLLGLFLRRRRGMGHA